jgi:hypothetical protein
MAYLGDIESILMEAYAYGMHNEVMEKANQLLNQAPYKFYPTLAYEEAFRELCIENEVE